MWHRPLTCVFTGETPVPQVVLTNALTPATWCGNCVAGRAASFGPCSIQPVCRGPLTSICAGRSGCGGGSYSVRDRSRPTLVRCSLRRRACRVLSRKRHGRETISGRLALAGVRRPQPEGILIAQSVCENQFQSRAREEAVVPNSRKPLPHGRGSDGRHASHTRSQRIAAVSMEK